MLFENLPTAIKDFIGRVGHQYIADITGPVNKGEYWFLDFQFGNKIAYVNYNIKTGKFGFTTSEGEAGPFAPPEAEYDFDECVNLAKEYMGVKK